ncbi:hypothetical protein [Pseudanabaena sp. PCC 6802]|uniref:hypothetical protein n=1 Tax=Pseudanabaena sp. PCC 6802 TaxID=118173 RepID=UPI0003821448|nr:hypothetical protein [Pseudanabaena sp. PCC 6802]
MKSDDEYSINDPREMTLRQLISSFSRVKISALLSIAGIFLAYSFAVFQLGCWLQNQRTAIALNRPFDMYLNLGQDNVRELTKSSKLELRNLILLQGEYIPVQEDRFLLKLRKIVDYDTIAVGNIIAQKGKIIDTPHISNWFAMQGAYAQQKFEWYGHEKNYRFREEFIDNHTIRRYYDDGWILEYKIDSQGRSILSTFRWIQRR